MNISFISLKIEHFKKNGISPFQKGGWQALSLDRRQIEKDFSLHCMHIVKDGVCFAACVYFHARVRELDPRE